MKLFEQVLPLLDQVQCKDAHRLRREAEKIASRLESGKPSDQLVSKLQRSAETSYTETSRRQALVQAIDYPEALPVSQRKDDIIELLRNHQVVVVAGETGSGKTTQLPKMCLELGLGRRGLIGHTQPRRIAARTVASRIADELKVELGDVVGYQVRFKDHSNSNTLVKLMTDGVLLAEIGIDRYLSRYEAIVIDEAHERSLNIDFLLGYLKRILPSRPDLKIVITSATIDVQRFSKHFDDAPVIEVSGRTFPVETWYRPLEDTELSEGIASVVQDILALESDQSAANRGGDFLVFCAGEREIRETSKLLRQLDMPLEVLPLYARLSLAEQNKIFQPRGRRRLVLATNVAETSVTVPGIRYVIDPGFARISRYSVKTKVQRLPIEAISQASANQRKGRCGRIAAGVCVRLYEESDFNSRPEFTEAEILRTNLAAVILQMLNLRLGDIRKFPFVDQPDNKLVNDGFKLLQEIGAVDEKNTVTKLGRTLSKLSIEPRFARMLLAAAELGCLYEVSIIVSALSIQDPRERPAEKKQAADEKHRRFADEKSDFLAYFNLWNHLEEQRQELSNNQFKNYCKKNFVSFLRLLEWRDIHRQLVTQCRDLDLGFNKEPATFDQIHQAILTGPGIQCRCAG